MDMAQLIDWCIDNGIQLALDEQNTLRVYGDASKLDEQKRQLLKAQKAEISQWLIQQKEHANGCNIAKVADSETGYNLSYTQRRIWFTDQFQTGNAQLNIPCAFRLKGHLDHGHLQSALNNLVARHEILRTTYQVLGEEPKQFVQPAIPVSIQWLDVSNLNKELAELKVNQFALEEAQKGFNLESDLMLRTCVIKISALENVVLFTMHHIAADGWSMSLLVNEFAEFYQSSLTQTEAKLEPMLLQYKDYAQWQRDHFGDDKLSEKLAHWQQALSGAPPLHALPLDKRRPNEPLTSGGKVEHVISAPILEQLKALAEQQGVTLFMLLESALSLLIARWSGESEVVIGSPIAGRTNKSLQPMIGCFLNNIIIRNQFQPLQKFTDVLQDIKQKALMAYADQDLPFEMIVDALQPQRNASFSPIYQITLVLQNQAQSVLNLPELDVLPYDSGHTVIKGDLEVSASEYANELHLEWLFADALFNKTSIEKMTHGFETLLASIVHSPDASIYDLSLSKTEHQGIIKGKEAAKAKLSILSQLDQFANTQPDAIALRECEYSFTYQELMNKVMRLACFLQEEGLQAGECIGVCLPRSSATVLAVLSIMRIGAVYVPMDPAHPKAQLKFIAQDANCEYVLSAQSCVDNLSDASVDLMLIDDCWQPSWLSEYQASMIRQSLPCASESDAYVLYTSGTTGQPKGVVVGHEQLLNYVNYALANYYNDKEIVGGVMSSSLSFDATITCLFAPLYAGKELHVIADDKDLMLAELKHKLFESSSAYVFKLTPSHLNALLELTTAAVSNEPHKLVLGGEQLTVAQVAIWCNDKLPNAVFVNEYGPTEATVGCVSCFFTKQQVSSLEGTAVPIGLPLDNVTCLVLDPQLQRVPDGAIGELYIAGVQVAKGYRNRNELTTEKFLNASEFGLDGERLYRTGDLVRVNNQGMMSFIGRTDNQIKIRGFRVELDEIKSLIEEQLGVVTCELLVREDETGNAIHAYLVIESQLQASEFSSELKSRLQTLLPAYAIPSALTVVSEIPLNVNGKVDKKALLAMDFEEVEAARPSTDLELRLETIWCKLLNRSQVGLFEDFFLIGGHSLLATRLITEVNQEFGCQLMLKDIFDMKTISALAAHLSFLLNFAASQSNDEFAEELEW